MAQDERRMKELTREAKWKIVYYCETMREKKSPEEAKRIADEKCGR